MDEPLPPQIRRYELQIRLPDLARPWHARLTGEDGTPALDFDTPLDLVRYLARQHSDESDPGLR